MLEDAIVEAIKYGERRLFVISGDESGKKASELLSRWADKRGGKVLVANLEGVLPDELEEFEGEVSAIKFDQSEEVMGSTWDALYMDFSRQMRPNDMGRLIEVVRGGGIILIKIPKISEWIKSLTEFQKRFLVPPFEERGVRQLFKRRFLNSLGEPGTFLHDLERGTIGELHGKLSRDREPKEEAEDPLLKMCATRDQQNALKAMIRALRERKRSVILTANRGRGKSAVLGMFLAHAVTQGRFKKVLVTAPSLQGIQTLFEFLMKGLEALGVSYNPVIREGNVVAVHYHGGNVFYMTPESASRLEVKFKVVDEAAAIPIPLLFKMLNESKFSIFSSTVHGYEGAGRGFTLRFLKRVRESGVKHVEIRMNEPIRYPPGDPVEAWLYKLLLLDAEPSDPPQDVDLKRAKYVKLNVSEMKEDFLRKFYGIYVLAHYRNRPNDLATLLDAPHHFIRALVYGDDPIVAMHIAEEGGLPSEVLDEIYRGVRDLPGHMIPSRVVAHYGFKSFGKLRGWRIVRIATHPELQGRGFGTRALEEFEDEAMEEGLDWIGAGFGVSEDLLRFWYRNGFLPLHISPKRNPVTGEYSVLVVKPLNDEARNLIVEINREFKRRLMDSLHDVYFPLNPMVARMLLIPGSTEVKLRLSQSQRRRLQRYLEGENVYELASDSIYQLARYYFWRGERCLAPIEEAVLVAKSMQGKDWNSIKSRFHLKGDPYEFLRNVITELVRCLNLSL